MYWCASTSFQRMHESNLLEESVEIVVLPLFFPCLRNISIFLVPFLLFWFFLVQCTQFICVECLNLFLFFVWLIALFYCMPVLPCAVNNGDQCGCKIVLHVIFQTLHNHTKCRIIHIWNNIFLNSCAYAHRSQDNGSSRCLPMPRTHKLSHTDTHTFAMLWYTI